MLPILFSLFSFFFFLTELYYTCYYPESDAFRNEVASIVNYFRQNGYNVIMDVMVSTEITSQGPTRWGESQIRKANKVLVFLSPGLINLALDGCDGFQSQVNTWYFSFWDARLFSAICSFPFLLSDSFSVDFKTGVRYPSFLGWLKT